MGAGAVHAACVRGCGRCVSARGDAPPPPPPPTHSHTTPTPCSYPSQLAPHLYLGDWSHAEAVDRLDELGVKRVVTIQTNNMDGILTKETRENGKLTRQVILDGKVVEETIVDEEKVVQDEQAATDGLVSEGETVTEDESVKEEETKDASVKLEETKDASVKLEETKDVGDEGPNQEVKDEL